MPQPARLLTHDGKTLTLDEWARRTKIPAATIRSRIDKQGWPVAKALTEPLDRRFGKRGKKQPANVPRPCPAVKATKGGRAYATWHADGTQHYRYFGRYGSDEAARAYRQFAAEWLAHGEPVAAKGGGACVGDLAAAFLPWAKRHYVKDGRPTSHYHRFKSALETLLLLHGPVLTAEYEADRLAAYVAELVEKGHSLNTVNEYQWRAVHVFEWGVPKKLVPPGVVHVLERVPKQVRGRSAAPESEPKTSVPPADVEAVMPYLHAEAGPRAVFEAMVRLQLASGVRPGEVCALRVQDIDRSRGDVWRYEPRKTNKNRHRGQRRVIWLGPRAQAILTPLLAGLSPGDHVFGYERRRGKRRSPVTVNLYRANVAKACEAAGVAPWHPHRLRHNRATEVQRRYEDDEAVRIAIGDTPEVARQIYVDDPAEAAAKRIARETG